MTISKRCDVPNCFLFVVVAGVCVCVCVCACVCVREPVASVDITEDFPILHRSEIPGTF